MPTKHSEVSAETVQQLHIFSRRLICSGVLTPMSCASVLAPLSSRRRRIASSLDMTAPAAVSRHHDLSPLFGARLEKEPHDTLVAPQSGQD